MHLRRTRREYGCPGTWLSCVFLAIAVAAALPATGFAQSYSGSVHPFGAQSLPDAYYGHDPEVLVGVLSNFVASRPQSDFETVDQYERRLNRMRDRIPTVGALTAADVHAVSFAPGSATYDPGRERLEVQIGRARVSDRMARSASAIELGSGITFVIADPAYSGPLCCAGRAKGAGDRLERLSAFELPMEAEEARLAEKGLRLLVAFQPAAPFVRPSDDASGPRQLHGRVLSLVVYNVLNGEVYDRFLTPLGESSMVEAPLSPGERTGPFHVILPSGALDASSRIDRGDAPRREYQVEATSTQIRSYFRGQLRKQGWDQVPTSFRDLLFTKGGERLRIRARNGRFEISATAAP